MRDGRSGYVVKVIILFAVYFITARIGLSLDAVSGFASAVWPPTGIALVAILLLGYRYWPGIFLAAFLVNVVTGAPVLVAAGMGLGNALEALVGAYLLTWVGFKPSLERVKDVLSLVVFAALISTMVSATIGVSSLLLGDVISSSAYGSTWFAWWIGDMLGNLVIAPLLLAWIQRPRMSWHPKRLAEIVLLVGLLIGVSLLAFHSSVHSGRL
jgi:two-component system, NarL family, sensor histidine kinase FusK